MTSSGLSGEHGSAALQTEKDRKRPTPVEVIAATVMEHREDPLYPDTCLCEVDSADAPGHYGRHLADQIITALREQRMGVWQPADPDDTDW